MCIYHIVVSDIGLGVGVVIHWRVVVGPFGGSQCPSLPDVGATNASAWMSCSVSGWTS